MKDGNKRAPQKKNLKTNPSRPAAAVMGDGSKIQVNYLCVGSANNGGVLQGPNVRDQVGRATPSRIWPFAPRSAVCGSISANTA